MSKLYLERNDLIAFLFSFCSTGVIWEARKKKSKRFRPLSLREGEIIESGYQRYHNEIKVGKTPKKLVQLENRIEVSYFVYQF